MTSEMIILEDRLKSWQDEKKNNTFGMRDMAYRAIKLIENDISFAKTGKHVHKIEIK